MPLAVSILVPLIVGFVLLLSGWLKLRQPDDPSGWQRLGVPGFLRRPLLVRAHPWGELVLGVAVLTLGGWLAVGAAFTTLTLMLAYTVLIWRALRQPDPGECACFGAPTQVSRAMLWRNLWLVLLAVVGVVVAWSSPVGGPLWRIAESGGEAAWWVLMAAAAALTTVLVLPQEPGRAQDVTESADDGGELDYLRVRTPAVPVTLADGSSATLRELSASKAMLLVAVSETCGSCAPVIAAVPSWRELLPELDLRLLVGKEPAESTLTSFGEPQSLHDPAQYVRQSLGYWGIPSAMLLGADGMLAGGPVSGEDAIRTFIAEIHEQLRAGAEAPETEYESTSVTMS